MDPTRQSNARNAVAAVPPRPPRRPSSTNARQPDSRVPQGPVAKAAAPSTGRQQPRSQSLQASGSNRQGGSHSAPSSSSAKSSARHGAANNTTRPASQPANAKPKAERQFEDKGGFRVLAPEAEKYEDLRRRQKIAEKARPKPKAAEMRFTEVADPSCANASDADRQAARQRWIDEMQAKADPKQIRRAREEKEREQREKEREEERAQRRDFNQQWFEREAVRQAVQQERTEHLNACARQHWSEVSLPASQPAMAEPVMPPEDIDFSAVRRRMAAERASRGAAIVAGSAQGRVLGRSPSPAPSGDSKAGDAVRGDTATSQMPPRTRCGELALNARAAVEQQRQNQAEQRAARSEFREIVATQDAEFEISLLHDRLKKLREEQENTLSTLQHLRKKLAPIDQRRLNAEQRLARYGENPKLRSELEQSQQEAHELEEQVVSAEQQLEVIETEVKAKEEMLALAEFT